MSSRCRAMSNTVIGNSSHAGGARSAAHRRLGDGVRPRHPSMIASKLNLVISARISAEKSAGCWPRFETRWRGRGHGKMFSKTLTRN